MLPHMTEQSTNVGEIAVDLMFMAETMIEDGEDPEDVRAAFIAVSIRLKQLRDEADADARQALAKAAGKVSTGTAQERWQGPLR
jgi:hypothetical protein